MANTVGVSGEQLAAQIATIESVTREAPEQIGNGLKTLYARFSDISGGGTDEDGVDLGKVTSQLDAIGVQVLDQFGNIRDVGDIMEDLMVV
jgi:TP901 family phage tail tape measure protein